MYSHVYQSISHNSQDMKTHPNTHKSMNGFLKNDVSPIGFLGGSESKESACNARDLGLIPGSGRSPGELVKGDGNPL